MMRRDALIGLGVATWFLLAAGAMGALWRFKTTPGAALAAPERFPVETHLVRTEGEPVLVLFAHPFCPCTRATLGELRKALSGFEGRVTAYVLFQPVEGEAIEESVAWQLARAIPGVRVRRDVDGRESHLFGALTSGHVVVYDGAGRMRFRGGITSSRGHEGENPGRARVRDLLRGELRDPRSMPVFGCSLEDPS